MPKPRLTIAAVKAAYTVLDLSDLPVDFHRLPEEDQQREKQAIVRQALIAAYAVDGEASGDSFQDRLAVIHGRLFDGDPTDIEERRARFFEEAIETVQAFGMSTDDMIKLVNYSGNRPVGEKKQEVGGAFVTLTSLCIVDGIDAMECAEADLEKLGRPETIERIRKKRSTRHGRGPLPGFDPVAIQVPGDKSHD